MYTREVTDTEMMDDDATLYESMDESGMEEYETLYDNYWDEDEADYYSNSYGTSSETSYEPISYQYEMPLSAKTGLMFWVFAGLLIVVLLGLRCIEKGNKIAKVMAAVGLVIGLISTILQLLAIWQVFPLIESVRLFAFNLSVMGKITIISSFTTVAAILGAMIMRIRESEILVKVLKWVAVGCGLVSWLLAIVVVFSTDFGSMGKVLGISVIMESVGLVAWVVAFIMSRFGRDETTKGVDAMLSETHEEITEFRNEPEPTQEVSVQETVAQITPVQPQQVEDVTVTDSFVDE